MSFDDELQCLVNIRTGIPEADLDEATRKGFDTIVIISIFLFAKVFENHYPNECIFIHLLPPPPPFVFSNDSFGDNNKKKGRGSKSLAIQKGSMPPAEL